MNLVTLRRSSTGWSENFGSGSTFRFGTSPLRGMIPRLLGALGAVLRPPLAAVADPCGIEGAADDVISHAGQILDSAASNQNDRMLLQIVPFAGDIGCHFHPIGQTNACHLAQRRV